MAESVVDRVAPGERIPARTALLLFGSVALVMNLSIAFHELGHLIADRLNGLDARIVLEPFGGSYTDLQEPFPDELMGWPEAAGPLANVAVGLLLLALLRRTRRPVLFPLLLWGPMALIQESTTAIVQLITDEVGTDFVRLVDAGVSEPLLFGGAVVGLVGGLVLLMAVMPVSGLDADAGFWSRAAVCSAGMGGYLLLSLLVSLLWGYDEADVARNGRLLGFVLILALLVAAVYRPAFGAPSAVARRDVSVVLAAAAVVVVSFLVW